MEKYINKKTAFKFIVIPLILLLTLAILVIGIPFLINKLLYIPIKTNGTDDKDWLAFWGSFLGGIIGGIATLVAVYATTKQNKDLKVQLNLERKPRIIPSQTDFYFIESYGRLVISEEYKLDKEIFICSEMIPVKFSNFGKEAALEIYIEWFKPTSNIINISETLVKTEKDIYLKVINHFKGEDNAVRNIDCIESSNYEQVLIHSHLMIFLEEITNKLIENIDYDDTYIRTNVPLGMIAINYKNVYEHKYRDYYELSFSIIGSMNKRKEYLGSLLFKKIDEPLYR